jgi:hypothetical protein
MIVIGIFGAGDLGFCFECLHSLTLGRGALQGKMV